MTFCYLEIDHQDVISIELFDNSVALKFLDELKWHIANSSINHAESFYGYADEDQAKTDLLDAIQTINSFLKTEYIVLPSEIDWDDRHFYNHLHECFEKLNGKWGSLSPLFQVSFPKVKAAIRQLNFSIHRLENRPYVIETKLYLSWNKDSYRRQLLTGEDHELFTNIVEPNTAYLGYVEVGKSLLDLYHDGLDPSYGGYENLHYVSAEAMLNFGIASPRDMFEDGFREWAATHHIDLNDKSLGLGTLPIGRFSGSDKNFTKHSKITNINIEEN